MDCFEEMAEMILSELREQGLVTGEDTFLERYCGEIMQGTKNPTKIRGEKMEIEKNK